VRATEHAYVSVREGILHGTYKAGARLTEEDLARSTGVSRTPIREALRRLQAEGLVRLEANHGAIVAPFELADAEEIFELRAVLEPIAAERAAVRADGATIAELRALAEQQALASTQRVGSYLAQIADLNDRFHRLVQTAAGSARLIRVIAGLTEALLILGTFAKYTQNELVRSADQHLELVQAFEARDPKWAHGIMRAHVLAGRAAYLRARGPAIEDPGS
jgi:DNA-binding GntR family transcriptional regulator